MRNSIEYLKKPLSSTQKQELSVLQSRNQVNGGSVPIRANRTTPIK
ncbi:hypothetical protein NIES2104_44410 [Leptolyngbya sp. NIES-2104]|nr:hypothetical protein NIES2104_44410 [Leptolyngbya sp. NIES-2104]